MKFPTKFTFHDVSHHYHPSPSPLPPPLSSTRTSIETFFMDDERKRNQRLATRDQRPSNIGWPQSIVGSSDRWPLGRLAKETTTTIPTAHYRKCVSTVIVGGNVRPTSRPPIVCNESDLFSWVNISFWRKTIEVDEGTKQQINAS